MIKIEIKIKVSLEKLLRLSIQCIHGKSRHYTTQYYLDIF